MLTVDRNRPIGPTSRHETHASVTRLVVVSHSFQDKVSPTTIGPRPYAQSYTSRDTSSGSQFSGRRPLGMTRYIAARNITPCYVDCGSDITKEH